MEPIHRDRALEEADPYIDDRSGEAYAFDADGYVPFSLAATVVCLRRRAGRAGRRAVRLADLAVDARLGRGSLGDIVAAAPGQCLELSGRWEVLMGQAQVVNYMRTDRADRLRVMRYPGEMRLPGGRVDAGDASLRAAAARELREEFRLTAAELGPAAGRLRLRALSASQTRRIRGASNMMVNFVAIADENPWLAGLDVAAKNAAFTAMERDAEAMLRDGRWAALRGADRARLSPEVHRLRWLDLGDALVAAQRSIGDGPADEWQAAEFRRAGVRRRDPMSVTCLTLLAAERDPGLLRPAPRAGGGDENDDAALRRMVAEASHRFSTNLHRVGRRRSALRVERSGRL